MKKVWILEKYTSKKEMESQIPGMHELTKFAKESGSPESVIQQFEEAAEKFAAKVAALPDDGGEWGGWEGKTNYKTFCYTAREAIIRDKKRYGKQKHQFRVVEAEIEDDAESWLHYNFIRVNDGVTRYLYATI